MADVNIAEPGAAIGFTGARVIKQATYADLPKGFQSAEFQLAHGQVDMVVPRTELRRRLTHLLNLYSSPLGSSPEGGRAGGRALPGPPGGESPPRSLGREVPPAGRGRGTW